MGGGRSGCYARIEGGGGTGTPRTRCWSSQWWQRQRERQRQMLLAAVGVPGGGVPGRGGVERAVRPLTRRRQQQQSRSAQSPRSSAGQSSELLFVLGGDWLRGCGWAGLGTTIPRIRAGNQHRRVSPAPGKGTPRGDGLWCCRRRRGFGNGGSSFVPKPPTQSLSGDSLFRFRA